MAEDFLSYINSMDFSDYDWDMGKISGLEEYLDALEAEDDDGKYYLEDDVASIDDIRDSLKYVEKIWKNSGKKSKIEAEISKLESKLEKLKADLEKL